jgi:LmbE family N-acetylglucosaminyl deacetylase
MGRQERKEESRGALRVMAAGLLLFGCGAARPSGSAVHAELAAPPRTLWVVAPHPDDEILMAAQALTEAVRAGDPYEIVIVTNGDYTCGRDGWGRQAESIAALASIGVTEDHVHFLGYPDGHLAHLGETGIDPLERRGIDGTCGTGSATYGARGAEQADVHSHRTGSPGPYVASALVEDLAYLFSARPPSEIHLPHPIDDHPDHAMTYAFVRRALSRIGEPARLVRHVVHAGPCWPASDPAGQCVPPTSALDGSPLPPLPPPLTDYAPDRLSSTDGPVRRAAIAHYVTQLDGPLESSWLASFARTTEVGWTESLVIDDGRARPLCSSAGSWAPDAGWSAPLEVAVTLPTEGELLVGTTTEGYAVRLGTTRIELLRHGADGTSVLRGMDLPAHEADLPTGRAIVLRVLPLSQGHAQIEVEGPEGFILGAIDPRGILEGRSIEASAPVSVRAL